MRTPCSARPRAAMCLRVRVDRATLAWGLASAGVATLFAAGEALDLPIRLFCTKDVIFCLAFLMLASLTLAPQHLARGASYAPLRPASAAHSATAAQSAGASPRIGQAFLLLSAVAMSYVAMAYLPDTWLDSQQELSRRLPVIELAWAMSCGLALAVVAWRAMRRPPEGDLVPRELRRRDLGLAFAAVLAMTASGVSIRLVMDTAVERDPATVAAEVAEGRASVIDRAEVVDAGGRLVGQAWMEVRTDYAEVRARLDQGRDAAWKGGVPGRDAVVLYWLEHAPGGAAAITLLEIPQPSRGDQVAYIVLIWVGFMLALAPLPRRRWL